MSFPLIVDILIIAYGKSSTWDERLTNKNIRIISSVPVVIAADRHWFLIISVYLISINFSTEKNLNNLRKV